VGAPAIWPGCTLIAQGGESDRGWAADCLGGVWGTAWSLLAWRTDSTGKPAWCNGGDAVWVWGGVVFVAVDPRSVDVVGDDWDGGDVWRRSCHKPTSARVVLFLASFAALLADFAG